MPEPRRRKLRRVALAWARRGDDFPVQRAAIAAVALIALVMLAAATTLAAHADPAGAAPGGLSAVDIADSKGIRVSQYELSLPAGNIVTNPTQMWLSMRLVAVWSLYRYGVALVAYVFDWTLGMTWLDALITPLDAAAQQIRDQVITPIGLVSLMLLVSAVVGGARIMYGRTGRGIWDIVSAAIIAAVVATLLVSPVAKVTGEPLTKARNIGIAVAEVLNGNNLSSTDLDGTPPNTLKPAPILIDAFVRPAHGLINYGVNFTNDQKCTPGYDNALKAGPYWDPSATKQRQAVGDCDPQLSDYAEKQSVYVASLGMGTFVVSGLLMGVTILVACVLLIVTVMMLAWSLLKLAVTGVIGIGPGDTRGPLIRNLFTAAASLVYVAVSTIVLALILVLIKAAFAADIPSPMGRFLLVDAMLIGGLVIIIQTWSAHRRGAQSWAEKTMSRLNQSVPKPTVGSRVNSWLAAPAGGEASKYGGLGGDGPGGGASTGVRRMLRPFTASNAAALAGPGGKAAWWAATTAGKLTGYTAVGAVAGVGQMTTATMRTAARVTGYTAVGTATGAGQMVAGVRRVGVAAGHTAESTQRIYDTYGAVRSGDRHATAGPHVDPWIHRAVRARGWLDSQTSALAATAALALGPHPAAGDRTTPTVAGQHRGEDPGRTTQRTSMEAKLTRPEPANNPQPHTVKPATPPTPGSPREHPTVVTVDPAATAAERVQQLVRPVKPGRHQRRPMQR